MKNHSVSHNDSDFISCLRKDIHDGII